MSTTEEFWSLYLERTEPNDPEAFGRNLDALRNALAAGGPGSPGPCVLEIRNVEQLDSRCPELVAALEEIGRELQNAGADVELFVMRFRRAGVAPRGGLYQHESFITRELEGAIVERLLSWTRREGECDMLWLKTAERPWQRFFLDGAGLTCCGDVDDLVEHVFEVVQGLLLVVLVPERDLVGHEIGLIRAHRAPDVWWGWLEIAFRSGRRLRLHAAEPSNPHSPVQLSFEKDT